MNSPQNDKLPFGILLLAKSLKKALLQSDAVKSKILGNALAIAGSSVLPANIEEILIKSNNFLKLSDEQKKMVARELDFMKRPQYDTSISLLKFITLNWVNKTQFEKKDDKPVLVKSAKPKMVNTLRTKKSELKSVSSKPVVIIRKNTSLGAK